MRREGVRTKREWLELGGEKRTAASVAKEFAAKSDACLAAIIQTDGACHTYDWRGRHRRFAPDSYQLVEFKN